MNRVYDRRFLGMLGFLGFFGFLGFLGSENYKYWSKFACIACLAALSFLIIIPRDASKVKEEYQLLSLRDILSVLAGRK